jgi:drug/metabolite transporter (DMT)-like permease
MSSSAAGPSGAPSAWPGIVLALLGAFAFSAKAIIVKLAYRHGVDAVTLIMYRMLFALPCFVLLAWWAGRRGPKLTAHDRWAVIGLGFSGYYLASLLDFIGLQYLSASLERLILYLGPTLVVLINRVVLKRRVSGTQLAALALSYGGVLLVFGQEAVTTGHATVLGAALVFGSAASYSVYLVASGQVVQRIGAMRLTGLATSVACGFCIGHFVLTRPLATAQVPSAVLWLSLLNALACTVAPVLMTMLAIARIGAARASQLSMVGPVSTVLLGIWLLGEPFTPAVAGGTLLVLAGVALLARRRSSAA